MTAPSSPALRERGLGPHPPLTPAIMLCDAHAMPEPAHLA
jgi:hypothetical protein